MSTSGPWPNDPFLNQQPTLTVSTAAQLTAALTSLQGVGGGVVRLAPGTYAGNFTLPPRTIIDGGNKAATTLIAPNGSNASVVTGINFATLTGKAKANGDYALGAYESGLMNVTVDGNKANNASGFCLQLWGRAPIIFQVNFQNGAQGDIWTEFTDVDNFGDSSQKLEGFFQAIKSANSGGDGWTMRGPHDSDCWGYISYGHAGWALTSDAIVGNYLGGIRMWELNSYLNVAGCLRTLNSGWANMYGGTLSGANQGTGFSPSATGGQCRLVGIQMSGRLIGFDLKGASHLVIASVANMPPAANSDIIKLNTCNGCHVFIDGQTGDINVGSNCNVVNAVADNLNSIQGMIQAGLRTTPVAGVLNSSSRIDLQGYGSGGAWQRQQMGTSTLSFSNGYSPTFSQESGQVLTNGGGGSNATIAAGAGAGTAPTVTITGNYRRGTANITIGTTPAIGVLGTITLNRDVAPAALFAQLVPKNTASAAAMSAAQIYVTTTTTTLVINAGVAPTAGAALSFDYFVSP